MEGIYVSKCVGHDNKNSLKQLALTVHGLIFRRAYYRKDFCVKDLKGLIFRRAYFWGSALSEFYGMLHLILIGCFY